MCAHEVLIQSCPSSKKDSVPLAQHIKKSIESYLEHLDGYKPVNLYHMVLEEVECSLLATVLKYTKNNQCQSASILGISRGTLRKKLKQYKL